MTFQLGIDRLLMALLRRTRRRGRSIVHWVKAFALGLGWIITRRRLPSTLLFFGVSPGDDLLCTAVLRELRNRGDDGLLMISNYGELFIGNEDVADVRPAGAAVPREGYNNPGSTVPIYRKFAKLWGSDFRTPVYGRYLEGEDKTEPPPHHIIADMCANAEILGSISIRPHLRLTEQEKSRAAWAGGRIVIQSSGMAAIAPMRNKEWFAERFQGVIDALRDEYEFIQLGLEPEPALEHVEDLRGCTSIRELAVILHSAAIRRNGRIPDAFGEGDRLPRRYSLRRARSALAIGLYLQFKPLLRGPLCAVLALEFLRLRSKMHDGHIGAQRCVGHKADAELPSQPPRSRDGRDHAGLR